jgi:hypothetical protein
MRKPLLILMSLVVVMLPGVAFAPNPTNNFVTVPEPSTILLLVSGLLGLWVFRKKFRK